VPPALSFTTKHASNSSIDQGGGKRRGGISVALQHPKLLRRRSLSGPMFARFFGKADHLQNAANPLVCGDAVAGRSTIKPLKLQDLVRP
jgi:hypothetical protein